MINSFNLINNNVSVTVETLMNKYLGVTDKNHYLIEVIEHWNERKKLLIEQSTYKHYVAALKHVKNYLKHQYKVTDIDIKQVDYWQPSPSPMVPQIGGRANKT